MTMLAMVTDLDRCTGCCSCIVACGEEHGLPTGLDLIRVVQIGPEGEFPRLAMHYLPVACQQCGHPSCAAACPELAIGRTEAGFVTVDPGRCTGCGECEDVCPYSAIVVDPGSCLARKCDLCADRLGLGLQPACVATCPARALRVVDLDEVAPQETSARSADHVLKPAANTDPGARYILTRQEWRDLG